MSASSLLLAASRSWWESASSELTPLPAPVPVATLCRCHNGNCIRCEPDEGHMLATARVPAVQDEAGAR